MEPYVSSATPVAMWAFQMRAPSTWTAMPIRSAAARSATSRLTGWMLPPAKLWVFSTDTAAVRTKNGPRSGATSDSRASMSTSPREPVHVRIVTPATAPCAPSSARAMCALDSHSTSVPTGTSTRTASRLASEPVGVNSAASNPNSPATRSSSVRTVGSSA